jgi:hypothetical protein
MTDYGFTAGRDSVYADAIIGVLKEIENGNEHTYSTGGAQGGDAIIGRWLAENYPQAKHLIFLPTRLEQIEPWWEGFTGEATILTIKPNIFTSYRDRNRAIVERSDVVYGFPSYPEDSPLSARSGTWQTIRMAQRKLGVENTRVYIQNEMEHH